jgi:hypothetical protein
VSIFLLKLLVDHKAIFGSLGGCIDGWGKTWFKRMVSTEEEKQQFKKLPKYFCCHFPLGF